MNIEKAKQALWDCQKITHKLFMPHEYVYIENGQMFDEENRPIDMQDFWNNRTDEAFKEGWEFSNLPTNPKSGIVLISEERAEQVKKHGYDLNHDNLHNLGQLRKMAAILCCVDTDARVVSPDDFQSGEDIWGLESKLNSDIIHRLKVAGALIAAEIDRIQCRQPF